MIDGKINLKFYGSEKKTKTKKLDKEAVKNISFVNLKFFNVQYCTYIYNKQDKYQANSYHEKKKRINFLHNIKVTNSNRSHD